MNYELAAVDRTSFELHPVDEPLTTTEDIRRRRRRGKRANSPMDGQGMRSYGVWNARHPDCKRRGVSMPVFGLDPNITWKTTTKPASFLFIKDA
jgi:hypothetical protein